MNVSTAVNFTSDGRTDGINDTDGFGSLCFDCTKAGESIGGFTRLRNN